MYELRRASQADIDDMMHRQQSVLGGIMNPYAGSNYGTQLAQQKLLS